MQLEDRLYSSSEVARILGVSRRTLYRYLESGTLGSMHLPSGRHRFTKEQVEAFLVKTFGSSSVKNNQINDNIDIVEEDSIAENLEPIIDKGQSVERPSIFSKIKSEVESKKEIIVEPVIVEEVEELEDVKEPEDEVEEDEILLENQDEEVIEDVKQPVIEAIQEPIQQPEISEQSVQSSKVEEEDVDEVVEDLKRTLSSLFDDSIEEEKTTKVEKKDKNDFKFYTSSITDLKKLAKTVKVASENSNVQYSFTGQAGASLFGEVSPFGQLHLYIKKNDMLFFEKRFDLAEASEEESNVALKVVDDLPEHTIVMGFKVVNLATLKKDLIQLGDSATAQNLEG